MVPDILGACDFCEMRCKLLVHLAWWQQNQTRRKPKKQETRKQDQTQGKLRNRKPGIIGEFQ